MSSCIMICMCTLCDCKQNSETDIKRENAMIPVSCVLYRCIIAKVPD